MRSDATTSFLPNNYLYIIFPESYAYDVLRTITRETHIDWMSFHRIFFRAVPKQRENDKQYITSIINQRASTIADGPLHVLTLAPVDFIQDRLHGNVGRRSAVTSLAALQDRHLPQLLKTLELDYLSITWRRLHDRWDHGAIKRDAVEQWLNQFEKAGGNLWIGRALLNVLDFWTNSELLETLDLTKNSLRTFDCVAVNDGKLGSSSSKLANGIRKRLDSTQPGSTNLTGLRDAIRSSNSQRILFIEDCLITGNEMTRVFLGLLGREDPYGSAKASALHDPEELRSKEICLRFAVATNWGRYTLESFLRREKMWNITLDDHNTYIIDVLTPDGLSDLGEGWLLDSDHCVTQPGRNLVRVAFQNLDIWSSKERREKALRFCGTIGHQLYALYLKHKGKNGVDRWVEEAGLGVQGLALALAFSHSVPKETLPLYWMGGDVEYGGRTIEWIPLFPNGL